MCNVIQNEMHYYIGPIQIYSGAEVSHTNRCRSVRTLWHYNLVPNCPGAEVPWCRSVPRANGHTLTIQGGAKNGAILSHCNILKIPWPYCVEIGELLQYYMLNMLKFEHCWLAIWNLFLCATAHSIYVINLWVWESRPTLVIGCLRNSIILIYTRHVRTG